MRKLSTIAAMVALELKHGLPEGYLSYRVGKKPNKYSPSAPLVRNSKIAAHIQMMHDKWLKARKL